MVRRVDKRAVLNGEPSAMKKSSNTNRKDYFISRVAWSCIIILVAFTVAIGKLASVQLVHGSELAEKQASFTNANIEITAARGDIYDEGMNILVQDATVSSVYAYPESIGEEDVPGTCSFLSEKLGMDYEYLYGLLTDKSQNTVTIKYRVDNRIAREIQEANLPGINIKEDKTRIYTNPTFAPYILGFTGTDHTGLYGVEAAFNEYLSGKNGVKSVLFDSNGNASESASTTKKESQKGDSVVLTIDSVTQYYTETAAYEAYTKYNARRVIILVSDVDTGAILGMAAYPSYSLDDPWSVSWAYKNSMLPSEGDSLEDQQLSMWSDPFTSYLYEPGSTFKIVTCASALEEGMVNLDSVFYCGGAEYIEGVEIRCDVYPGHHGDQDLATSMANSCNVALMKIVNLVGPDKFYDYIYNFGFGTPTGILLDGEESGMVSANQDVNPVDFATLGFGQGLAATPLQMIMGLNAAINGGYLMVPRVVEKVVDSNTGETVMRYDPQVVRQVISEQTSETMRYILGIVADQYYYLGGYESYDMIGKTGTAEQYRYGSYDGSLVASFYGALPESDPEFSVLVIVDEASGDQTYGSNTAAPTAAKLMANIYDYMAAKDMLSMSGEDVKGAKIIPDVRGSYAQDAVELFESLGIAYTLSGGESGIIVNQSVHSVEYTEGTVVVLSVSEEAQGETVMVPNVTGMSVQKANEVLAQAGLVMQIQGGGIAVSQSIEPGTMVEAGTTVTVTFRYAE